MDDRQYRPTPLQQVGRQRLFSDAIQAYRPEFLPPALREMAGREGLIVNARRGAHWNTNVLPYASETLLERIYCSLALTHPEGAPAEDHHRRWVDGYQPVW